MRVKMVNKALKNIFFTISLKPNPYCLYEMDWNPVTTMYKI